MSQSSRTRPRVTGVAFVSALLSAGLAACEPSAPPVVAASSSTRFVDAVRMALSDAEAEAPLPPMDTVFEGESTNLSIRAVENAQSFVSREGLVAVVGHSNSTASLAASQIYNERGVVQIAATSSAPVYSRAGPWSFRLVPPDDAQAGFLVERLRALLPEGGRVAVMYVNDDYGRGLLAGVLEAATDAAWPVVLQYPHTEEEALRPEVIESSVEALGRSEPDALLWLARASRLHVYLPAIREALPDLGVLGADAVASAPQHPNADGRWNGVRFADFVDIDATPALRNFARRYEERSGLETIGADALHYDAMGLVLAALREGARTPGEVRDFLTSLGRERDPFPGVTGPIRFDAEGDVERAFVLRAVADGSTSGGNRPERPADAPRTRAR